MKKTIAAILVTILASAGYIVLDKAAVEKIDTLASQVSSQQAVIDNLGAAADPLEMHTGQTLSCYPAKGTVVQAYVFDPSRTTTWATTTTTWTTTTTTWTTTTKPYSVPEKEEPSEPPVEPTATTTQVVYGQADEPTATTAPTTTTTTTEPVTETIDPEPTYPTTGWHPEYYYYEDVDYYYHLRTDVQIKNFNCVMVDKTLTGIPKFRVEFTGKVDPSFAGRYVRVWFGDDLIPAGTMYTIIGADGCFNATCETTLSNSAVISLREIRID